MKVGTDGVLIGAWARVENSDQYLFDIGSGTGLIALMLAQRSVPSAIVDAVEIDKDSFEQAIENINTSPWSQRVNIQNVDISNFDNNFKYDCIVSNPPFFCDSLLPPDQGRTTARHAVSLTFKELVSCVERLLAPDGRFSLILPTQESEAFERAAKGHLYLWRRCFVSSRVSTDTKRVMSEYRLTPTHSIECNSLAIREDVGNEYTQDYKNLTTNFYLKF